MRIVSGRVFTYCLKYGKQYKSKAHVLIGMTSEMMADVINVTRIGTSYSYYKKRLSGELLTEHNGVRDKEP